MLIQMNADYIMDAIARRLRSAAIMLRTRADDDMVIMKADAACRCLITLCYHAEDGIVPFLQTILHQVCLGIIDEYQEYILFGLIWMMDLLIIYRLAINCELERF